MSEMVQIEYTVIIASDMKALIWKVNEMLTKGDWKVSGSLVASGSQIAQPMVRMEGFYE
ncbi:hypothetical protein LCGC14_1069400 [marine sediment metagenome]|uniref:Uncharacterized protein n=1 Tax=marine sediment metagenome TaxID=412755 RepID=A0A0F9QPJ6_9ZZZZ